VPSYRRLHDPGYVLRRWLQLCREASRADWPMTEGSGGFQESISEGLYRCPITTRHFWRVRHGELPGVLLVNQCTLEAGVQVDITDSAQLRTSYGSSVTILGTADSQPWLISTSRFIPCISRSIRCCRSRQADKGLKALVQLEGIYTLLETYIPSRCTRPMLNPH
jgi:hypothetical protein